MICALFNKINTAEFNHNLDNIFIFKNVPQLKVLKNCNLMINHGGMQSITECIMFGVPMLSYPLTLDQPGNTARIKFHKIGLIGNIKKDSVKTIQYKVEKLLNSYLYKINIEVMKDKIVNCSDFEKGILFIESFINTKNIELRA